MSVVNPIVSSLENYVEQHKSELLSKTLLGSDNESRALFDLMVGVKGPTTLNIADYEIAFQPLSCGNWTNSGTTTYSQRMLNGVPIMVETDYCIANLLKTYAQTEVKIGAGRMSAGSFEEAWVQGVTDAINAGIEKMIYQGASGATNEFEGLISILENDNAVVDVTAASGTTAYAFLKNVYMAIPAQEKNASILVSPSLYREYIQDLVNAGGVGLTHYNPEDGKPGYPIPGSDVKVIPVAGLEGAGDYAIATNIEKNIVFGVSADEDIDALDVYFDRASKSMRLDWQAVMAVQVAFPDMVVLGKRG